MLRSSHELLIPDHDFAFDTISDVEQPLDEEMLAAGVGEVTGGGIGAGWYRIEMAIERPAEAFAVIHQLARRLGLPRSTLLRKIGETRAQPLDEAAAEAQETGG